MRIIILLPPPKSCLRVVLLEILTFARRHSFRVECRLGPSRMHRVRELGSQRSAALDGDKGYRGHQFWRLAVRTLWCRSCLVSHLQPSLHMYIGGLYLSYQQYFYVEDTGAVLGIRIGAPILTLLQCPCSASMFTAAHIVGDVLNEDVTFAFHRKGCFGKPSLSDLLVAASVEARRPRFGHSCLVEQGSEPVGSLMKKVIQQPAW